MSDRPVPGPHLHQVQRQPNLHAVATGHPHDTRPEPKQPPPPTPSIPLELPTAAECLVRIETARARRRGPAGWFSPEREQRAAALLHTLLRAAYATDVHLADFDAATDLPGAVLDTVVLLERIEASR